MKPDVERVEAELAVGARSPLYHAVFGEYVRARELMGRPDVAAGLRREAESFVRSYRLARPALAVWDAIAQRRPRGPCDLLVVGSKLYDLVMELSRTYRVAVLCKGSRARREGRRHRLPSIPGDPLVARLYGAALDPDPGAAEAAVARVVDDLCGMLGRLRPRAVVMFSNTSPLERALNVAGRAASVPTIQVQHGMLIKSPHNIVMTNRSDHMFTWGEVFREYVVENTRHTVESAHVLGYPFRLPDAPPARRVRRVCFLGQHIRGSSPEVYLERKLRTLTLLGEQCAALGLELVYRPHPTEFNLPDDTMQRIRTAAPGLVISERGEPLKTALREYDVFLSFYSTALMEASLAGRHAAQVLGDWGWECDDFEAMGACPRIDGEAAALRDFLREAAASPTPSFRIAQRCLYTPPSIERSFTALCTRAGILPTPALSA